MTDTEFATLLANCASYGEAASKLKLHLTTVITRANRLGLIKPNGGKREAYKLQDVLDGKHPQYPTVLLKRRLIKEGMLVAKCSICKLVNWLDKPIVLELDHIDGVRSNHKFENLRLLCPNCHSQTGTYKSKNIG